MFFTGRRGSIVARLLEGVKKLYKGKDAINRQICLFSICGIIGLVNAYLALGIQNINEVTLLQKIIFGILNLLFGLFFVGYETIFLHSRELPDINLDTIKLGLKKIPFIIFLIDVPIILLSLFSKFHYFAFCLDTILAIPMVIILAGFSYNYDDNDSFDIFKKFRVTEYFTLLLERIWIVIMSYMITFSLIFITFFVLGLIIAFIYKGDTSSIGFLISSQQAIISKLTSYITVIILTYVLSIGTLAWDYELVKLAEDKD